MDKSGQTCLSITYRNGNIMKSVFTAQAKDTEELKVTGVKCSYRTHQKPI